MLNLQGVKSGVQNPALSANYQFVSHGKAPASGQKNDTPDRLSPPVPRVPGGEPSICSRSFIGQRPKRLASSPNPRDLESLIADPRQALNVFDFEPVMKKNVPAAHFGYMATGLDDEVTLRANREGFLKFQLRPRRLVDVSKIDMSCEIFGATYDSPIVIAPTGSNSAFHPGRRSGRRQGGKDRKPSANSVHRGHNLRRGGYRRAWSADLVPALPDARLDDRRPPRQACAKRRVVPSSC